MKLIKEVETDKDIKISELILILEHSIHRIKHFMDCRKQGYINSIKPVNLNDLLYKCDCGAENLFKINTKILNILKER